jgi:hypothetical protein
MFTGRIAQRPSGMARAVQEWKIQVLQGLSLWRPWWITTCGSGMHQWDMLEPIVIPTDVWDVSPLLQALLSEEWTSECEDFKFTLGGKTFDKLRILVDGIYPPLLAL